MAHWHSIIGSCRASLLWRVWLAFQHSPALTRFRCMSKAGPLPSGKVMLSLPSQVIWAHQTPQPDIPLHFTGVPLIGAVTAGVACRPGGASPVPRPTLPTFRSPYAGGFFGAALPGSSRLPWPSPLFAGLGSLLTLTGTPYDAAGFTLCYGLAGCDDTASTLGLLLTPGGRYRAA